MEHCKLSDSDAERKFKEDLETAKALSLETMALEEFKKEKLKQSQPATVSESVRDRGTNSVSVYSNVTIRRSSESKAPESLQLSIQIKPRPRPGGLGLSGGIPPPLPKHQPTTSETDLINLKSPLKKNNPHDILLKELDQACLSHKSDIMTNNANIDYILGNSVKDVAAPLHIKPNSNHTIRSCLSLPKMDVNILLEKPTSSFLATTDLIDLGANSNHPRYSVLSAFDPLLNSNYQSENGSIPTYRESLQISETMVAKGEENLSYIQDYDPFEYYLGISQQEPSIILSSLSLNQNKRETIYEVLTKEQSPVRIQKNRAIKTVPVKTESELMLKLNVSQVNLGTSDSELTTFVGHICDLRNSLKFDDLNTNLGYVISPKMEAGNTVSTSVKMIVYSSETEQPVTFTCDISSTVDHVISHVLCEVGHTQVSTEQFILKVWGKAEYFTPNSCLHDYEYVHHCIKLEKDVRLKFLHTTEVKRPLSRTVQDDDKDVEIKVADLLPREPVDALTYESVCILLDTIHGEVDRLINSSAANPKALLQAVKALCSMLGCIETTDLSVAVDNLTSACGINGNNRMTRDSRPEIIGEEGPYSLVVLPNSESSSLARLRLACADILSALRKLILAYTIAYRVNFSLEPTVSEKTYLSSDLLDCVSFRICALHRLDPAWTFDQFEIRVELFHGVVSMARSLFVRGVPSRKSFLCSNRIAFDEVVSFQSVAICTLPRESRLVLTVYGRRRVPEGETGAVELVELGWTAQNFFRFSGNCWTLAQGGKLLPLWPMTSDKRIGHVPNAGRHPHGHSAPLLSIELPERDEEVHFPDVKTTSSSQQPRELSSLDDNTQQTLLDIVASGSFVKLDLYQRELLWEKRHYLTEQPGALAKILLVARSWDWASLADLYWLLEHWSPLSPLEALQLLLPCFPDVQVRRSAVAWLQAILSDELVDYLPQLVEALKVEPYDHSPLLLFLVERSLTSPKVAHALYWILNQQLPGASPQNSDFGDLQYGVDPRYSGRLQLLLRSLLATCGDSLRQRFLSEQLLVQQLDSCAELVKTTKETYRLNTVLRELEPIHFSLEANPTSLPISPSLQVKGLEVRSCGYFPSNTLPLKLVFRSAELEVEGEAISAMYKVGDDLRQDSLTIQMVRIMDKMWLKSGLDLKMVTFACVPTGTQRGFVELITGAETLRRIQIEHGLTGSFKDRPIADWLAKHNPSPLEYERAVHNFTASCAGYSVATYVFGVCDRHNDNIMVKSTGHLFHIDFGKFLGDAQMFGNFKRDRTPFVLTSDMAYVINGGDKPSQKFHHFVDLCCQAFNIVRHHSNQLLHLLALMATSGIPGVNADGINYVQRALLPDKSKAEASAMFARMIEDSLRSWFTQFNFFLHNLAQLRFHGDHNDGQLLSFVPKTFTMAMDGRIIEARVVGFQKRYDPEKYYVYIVSVQREKESDKLYLFRSYREFCELYQKLCLKFPLISNQLHSLSKGVHLGRSSVKVVAEKRRAELDLFLISVFEMAEEVSHSDIVYTFLHPLLRDQDEEANVNVAKWRNKSTNASTRSRANINSRIIQGQLKISVQYTRGELHIMIQHGRELYGEYSNGASGSSATTELPSPYVKTYLLPDVHKITKRKTRVIRKNANPTFMEMLVYRMPLDLVRNRVLQVSAWSYDVMQENDFLGQVQISLESLDLTRENVGWYSLGS